MFRLLTTDLVLTWGSPNRWWRHQHIWSTEGEEPEWVSLEEHWTAWSTISEMGPRRDDPTESGLLADPDWVASELTDNDELESPVTEHGPSLHLLHG